MSGIEMLKNRFKEYGYIYIKPCRKTTAIYFYNKNGKSFSTKTNDFLRASEIIAGWIENGFPLSKEQAKKKQEKSVLVSDYLSGYWKDDTKTSGITQYYRKINISFIERFYTPFFSGITLEMLDSPLLRKFYDYSRGQISKKTGKPLTHAAVNGIMAAGLKPLKEAGNKTGIDWSDVVKVKKSDFAKNELRRGILTDDEIQTLLNSEWSVPRNKLAFLLCVNLGLRVGEIRALRICSITEKYIRVNCAYNDFDGLKGTKTERNDKDGSRVLPIDNYLYEQIQAHIRTLPPFMQLPECFLFTAVNDTNKPIDIDSFRRSFYKQLKLCGIERKRKNPVSGKMEYICFYSLRHNTATKLMRSGVDINTIARYMGHSVGMVQHYSAHIDDSDTEILRGALATAGVETLKPADNVVDFPAVKAV